MIHQTDLTYNRFPRSNDFQQRKTPVQKEEKTAEEQGQKVRKPNRSQPQVAGAQETRNHMHDLVARLEAKSDLFQSPVNFQIEGKKPHIVMTGGESDVLNRFESEDDLMELERSLHDMAGFRFSVVG